MGCLYLVLMRHRDDSRNEGSFLTALNRQVTLCGAPRSHRHQTPPSRSIKAATQTAPQPGPGAAKGVSRTVMVLYKPSTPHILPHISSSRHVRVPAIEQHHSSSFAA